MPYKVDFKHLATEIDIGDVANLLQLKVVKDRAACPLCDSERAIQIFVETNSFRCHKADISGDCIALYAHIEQTGMYKSALALQEHFRTAEAGGKAATAPQRPEGRPAKSQPAPTKPERAFDPEAFAAKLAHSPEVEALGISQEDAERLGIGFCAAAGFMRGRVCIPVRNEDGSVAGYIGWNGTDVKVPHKWQTPTVVTFKKRA